MRRIRIVHIVENLHTGGLERVVATIATGLNQTRFDARVLCVADGGSLVQTVRDSGVEVRILNLHTYHNPFNLLRIARALNEIEPDVVHTHGYFASTAGRIAALLARVPVRVAHYHTLFYGLKQRNVLIDKLLNAFSHQIIFLSENARASFAAGGYCMKNATVIYNGVDDRYRMPWTGSQSGHRIIIIASLTPAKGHTWLLRAMRTATVACPDAILQIVGDGPLRGEIGLEAERLGIAGHVHFLGLRDDVFHLLSRSDIAVVSSTREGLSLAALEAMAAGLPVVATRVGGLQEVVQAGETGVLVPPEDPDALAAALMELLNDPIKRTAMGARGRAFFEKEFSSTTMIAQLERLYENLIRQNRVLEIEPEGPGRDGPSE